MSDYTNSDEFKPAKNLTEVMIKCDVDWEIPPDCPFIVQLNPDPLTSLKRKLKIAETKKTNIYFIGHRGCGKTIQIHKLINEIHRENKFALIPFYLDVKKILDPETVGYQDLIYAIVATVYKTYTEDGEKKLLGIGYNKPNVLSNDINDKFLNWGKTIISEIEKSRGFSFGVSPRLPSILDWFFGSFKLTKNIAETARQVVEPKIENLLEIFSDIVAEIEKKEKKKVVVLIDGMEKIKFERAQDIFETKLEKIVQPACSLIYVMPTAISAILPSIDFFNNLCSIHNIPIFEPIGQFNTINNNAEKIMEKIIHCRVDNSLIEKNALKELIKLSAGVILFLIQYTQKAAEIALERGSSVIETEDVKKVSNIVTYFFNQNLAFSGLYEDPKKAILTAKGIQENPHNFPMDKTVGLMLHHLMVIEYPNDPQKYGIHPALKPIIKDYES